MKTASNICYYTEIYVDVPSSLWFIKNYFGVIMGIEL